MFECVSILGLFLFGLYMFIFVFWIIISEIYQVLKKKGIVVKEIPFFNLEDENPETLKYLRNFFLSFIIIFIPIIIADVNRSCKDWVKETNLFIGNAYNCSTIVVSNHLEVNFKVGLENLDEKNLDKSLKDFGVGICKHIIGPF